MTDPKVILLIVIAVILLFFSYQIILNRSFGYFLRHQGYIVIPILAVATLYLLNHFGTPLTGLLGSLFYTVSKEPTHECTLRLEVYSVKGDKYGFIRKEDSPNASIMRLVAVGKTVYVSENVSNGWRKIALDGENTGYIANSRLGR